jgi:hypothetical protein
MKGQLKQSQIDTTANTKIYGSDLRNLAVEIALAQHGRLQVAKRIET